MTSQPLVRCSGNRLITTSLAISNHFNKKHKDVLRAIKTLDCSDEFNRRNFTPVSYADSKGEQRPMYEITRDGFVFLCMGFTGHAAAVWKEKYIAAFNAMEAELHKVQAADTARLQQLQAAYLAARPEARRLLRYREMGLQQTEIGRLLGISPSAVRERLKKLAALGLADYRPDPALSGFGRLGLAVLRQKQAFWAQQQSLEWED